MKIFGHPVHLMLVHFPSALLPMDLLCSAFGWIKGDTLLVPTAFYSLCGGVFMGWAAVVSGALDLPRIPAGDNKAMVKALWHGSINTLALIGFTVVFFLEYRTYPTLSVNSGGLLSAKLVLVAFIITGNFLGGSLILKHKIAVERDE
jgi:uncharacterized membrane protein